MTTIVVDTMTLEFMNMWPSNIANPPVVTGPNPQVTLETSEDPSILRAVIVDDLITLQTDPTKLAAKTTQAWGALRARRNALLAASDWTALADAHLSQAKKDAWFAYRQELRDLPDAVTDPTQVEWPLDPTQTPAPAPTGSRIDNLLNQA
jgi:hypothetical protein